MTAAHHWQSIPLCSVLADEYPIGSDTMPYSQPAHRVTLAAFAIMQTTVTNRVFADFVQAGGYQSAEHWTAMGWRWKQSKSPQFPTFRDDPRFNEPAQPVVGISWYEALAFTNWLSTETAIRWCLPTEAQWEAAARGHDEAIVGDIYTAASGSGHPVAANRGNVSWCGAVNMLGNVWEWCSTRWGRNWQTLEYPYPYDADDGREDLSGSDARVMRGGSWFDAPTESHVSNRARYLPGSRGSNIGFRLVQLLENEIEPH